MSDPKATNKNAPVDPKKTAKPAPLPDAEFNKTWDQEKNYKFVKRFNDPRFGEITVVKNPSTNHVLMVKEKMVSGKNEATDDIMNLKSRLALNHPNMMRMVNYTTTVKKELCSTHYLSRAYYEFPKTDVHKEIIDRKRDLTEFNDRELTHMLYQTAFGLQNLHSKNMVHGDIRPQLIGYDKALNQYQILDRFADPTPLERCQTNNIVNNKDLYLSPQLYKKLKGADKKATYDSQKNDMHALGMTLLNAGTQDSMQDNYLPNGTINKKRLEEHLQEFDNKHGARNPILCQTVRKLLTEEEAQRPNVNELLNGLPTYDQFKQVEAQGGVFGAARPVVRAEPPVEPVHVPAETFEYFTETKREAPTIVHAPAPVYEAPQVLPVEGQTVYYTRPITHNIYSQPVTQYNDYSYVSEKRYESIPNTTYISTQDNTSSLSNVRYSHTYTDYNRVQPSERVVVNTPNYYPTEMYNVQTISNQYIPSERIVETRVVNAPETRNQVVSERRSYVVAPATESKVVTQVVPEYRTETRFVNNSYNVSNIGNNLSTNYVTEQRKSIRFLNAEDLHRHEGNTTNQKYEYTTTNNYNTNTYTNVQTVPVDGSEKVIRKRYIKRQDGTIVEIEGDSEISIDDVRRRLQAN